MPMLLALTFIVRVLVISALPAQARSVDLQSWSTVTNLLLNGINPYHATSVLNWPPLWPALLYLFGVFSHATQIPLNLAIRIFLAAVDVVLAWALMRLGRRLLPAAVTN